MAHYRKGTRKEYEEHLSTEEYIAETDPKYRHILVEMNQKLTQEWNAGEFIVQDDVPFWIPNRVWHSRISQEIRKIIFKWGSNLVDQLSDKPILGYYFLASVVFAFLFLLPIKDIFNFPLSGYGISMAWWARLFAFLLIVIGLFLSIRQMMGLREYDDEVSFSSYIKVCLLFSPLFLAIPMGLFVGIFEIYVEKSSVLNAAGNGFIICLGTALVGGPIIFSHLYMGLALFLHSTFVTGYLWFETGEFNLITILELVSQYPMPDGIEFTYLIGTLVLSHGGTIFSLIHRMVSTNWHSIPSR